MVFRKHVTLNNKMLKKKIIFQISLEYESSSGVGAVKQKYDFVHPHIFWQIIKKKVVSKKEIVQVTKEYKQE